MMKESIYVVHPPSVNIIDNTLSAPPNSPTPPNSPKRLVDSVDTPPSFEILSQVDENGEYLLKPKPEIYYEFDNVNETVWEALCRENSELKEKIEKLREKNKTLNRKYKRLVYGYTG